MKINIKSNKGVTITGLVIYVSSFFMICAVIAVITTFFHNNTEVLSSQATASAEYDILNAYLAKEAKTENNKPIIPGTPATESNRIKFEKENQYIYKGNAIYLCNETTNKCFIVANYIEDAAFIVNNNNTFTMKIIILGKEYTQTYHLKD